MFCSKCGVRLEENESACKACDFDVSPQDTQASTLASVVEKAIVADALGALRAVFTKSPQKAIALASQSATHMWAIFAGLFLLLGGLVLRMMISNLFSSMLGGIGSAFMAEIIREIVRPLFPAGLILMAVQFLMMLGIIKLMFIVRKVNLPFMRLLNLVGVMTVPFSAGLLLAFVFSFFSVNIALWFILAGLAAYVAMAHSAISTAEGFESISSIWLFTLLFAGAILAFRIGLLLAPFNAGDVFGGLF